MVEGVRGLWSSLLNVGLWRGILFWGKLTFGDRDVRRVWRGLEYRETPVGMLECFVAMKFSARLRLRVC